MPLMRHDNLVSMTVSPDRKNDLHQHPDLRLAPQLQNLSYHFFGTLPAKELPEKKFPSYKERSKKINGRNRQKCNDQGRTKINRGIRLITKSGIISGSLTIGKNKEIIHILGLLMLTQVMRFMTELIPTNKPVTDVKLFPWWLLLVWGILALLIGIMFVATPGMTTVFFITFLGAYWLVGGLFTLGSLFVDRTNGGWKIFFSVINIIAGILILMYPLYSTFFIIEFFIIFIGFWACFIGGAYLFTAFPAKDTGAGVLGAASLIFGILILIFPLISGLLIPYIIGGFTILAGISSIVISFVAKKELGTTL